MQATPEQVSCLIKLQQADMALIKARKQFDELPQRAQIRDARLKREQVLKKQAQADELRRKAEAEASKLEDEDATLAEKARQVQELIDQAQGDFRNVESRTKELGGIAKRRAKIEEELSAKAEELDKIGAVAAQIGQALDALASQEEKATASFQNEGGALKAAIMQLESQRGALEGELGEDIAALYNKTAARCGGVAVALLSGEKCGACRMSIDHGKLVEIKREAPLSTCPHCKRMLVINQ